MQEKTYRKLHLPLHICPFYLGKLEPLDAHICMLCQKESIREYTYDILIQNNLL